LDILNEIHTKFGIKPIVTTEKPFEKTNSAPTSPSPASLMAKDDVDYKSQHIEEDSDDIKFIITENQTKVRAATIEKLIERLTDIRFTG
jgi:hypothetical protein